MLWGKTHRVLLTGLFRQRPSRVQWSGSLSVIELMFIRPPVRSRGLIKNTVWRSQMERCHLGCSLTQSIVHRLQGLTVVTRLPLEILPSLLMDC